MKCLNCKTSGTHFQKKICPGCTSKGVTRDDIAVKRDQMTFIGRDASQEAGEFVEDLKKKHNISHVRYKFKANNNPDKNEMKVTWNQYEPKSGGTDGGKKANKS